MFVLVCQKVISTRVQLLHSISSGSSLRPSTPQQQQQQPNQQTTSSIRLLAGSHMNGGATSASMLAAIKDQPCSSSVTALIQASTQSLGSNGNTNGVHNNNTNGVGGGGCPTYVNVTSPNGCGGSSGSASLAYYLANPHLINTANSHAAASIANNVAATTSTVATTNSSNQVKRNNIYKYI